MLSSTLARKPLLSGHQHDDAPSYGTRPGDDDTSEQQQHASVSNIGVVVQDSPDQQFSDNPSRLLVQGLVVVACLSFVPMTILSTTLSGMHLLEQWQQATITSVAVGAAPASFCAWLAWRAFASARRADRHDEYRRLVAGDAQQQARAARILLLLLRIPLVWKPQRCSDGRSCMVRLHVRLLRHVHVRFR
jgi:hypothetical protein